MTDYNADQPLSAGTTHLSNEDVIPVIHESLTVEKRLVEAAAVHLHIRTEEHLETVQVPLTSTQWNVEHVLVNRVVRQAPEVRVEGATTIYPILEERVVISRELVLVQELHVTRIQHTDVSTSEHTVRQQVVTEERTPLAR